jgi:cellulose synthase/poly-beta-1,6-N-acetylglucosamine synthase-like glycosyltransferase
MDDIPFISIIVPVHSEEDVLRRCLASLEALDYPAASRETILVNDGDNPATNEIIAESGLTVLSSGGRGPSAARNMGIARARGDLVAFTDADCVVDGRWLSELAAPFGSGEDIAGVGGSQAPSGHEGAFAGNLGRFIQLLGFFLCSYTKPYYSVTEVSHNPSCNVMYRTAVLREAGGFREGLWPGEDLELDVRLRKAGRRLLYNPAAVVYHARPQKWPSYARMMFGYGCWAGGWLTKRYGFFRWLCWEPFLFYGLLGITIAIAAYAPAAGLAFFLGGCAVIAGYFLARTGKPVFSLFCTGALLVTLAFWNAGFVRGLFARLPGERETSP